jgi:hypothetical protein
MSILDDKKYKDAPADMRRLVDRQTKGLAKALSSPLGRYALAVGLAALGALILAPYLAGAIGSAMGLSGAAATSAGLAALGGGSIAAGGFGMLGGQFAIMAGGSILGYLGANEHERHRLRQVSEAELLVSCAKQLALLEYEKEHPVLSAKKRAARQVRILAGARQMLYDIEREMDESLEQDRDTNLLKEGAKKVAVLRAFRDQVRTM